MTLYEEPQYLDDVKYVTKLDLPWEKLMGKSVLVSGAVGLIGSFLIDVLMEKQNIAVYALGRSKKKAKDRFSKWINHSNFHFITCDVNEGLAWNEIVRVDYVLHLASNTHPLQYSTDPIGTITTNMIGLRNMLEFSVDHQALRFVFASSNEIYGENRGDVEFFDEKYCGYIDSNTMRAGYPESKRCGEALCQAYRIQKGLDIVIPRFTRSYGPTMLLSDTKAISQFIRKAIAGEDIVLKSVGTQYYSYTYVSDAVSGLLTVLLCGKSGEAYNIADETSDIALKDLANIIAAAVGKKVVFELPDNLEAKGYSRATKARLDGSKLKKLGWSPRFDINRGIIRVIEVLGNTNENGKNI